MDFSQQYADTSLQDNSSMSSNYRLYPPYTERDDMSSMMFSTSSNSNESTAMSDRQRQHHQPPMLILNPHSISDPWQNLQNNHTPQTNFHQPGDLSRPSLPHSERGIAGFVSKLYQCLQSTDSSQKYARWCQHDGKDMFIIENIPEFTEVVLPRLFKHCKFPSFVRQLNIYGFQRDTDARKTKDTKDKESCRWYHPFFRPGRRDLFHLIRRKAARYSRRKRSKVEEDPETILNVGSGDESDGEQSPQLNNSIEESVQSPSVSPASENMQPISTTSSSQLQLTYSEPVHTTLTNGLNAPAESPAEHNSLQSIPEEQIQHQQQQQHPPAQHPLPPPSQHQQQQKNQPTPENLDDMIDTSPTPLSQPDPLMRDQELRLQLYHMRRHYERMRSYFDEQLNNAQIQIDEQHLHIQQLETALGITRHTVKPSTIHNPRYLRTTNTPYNGHFVPLNNNNNNNSSSSNRSSTTSQHRLMTQQQQPMEYMPLKTSPVHSTNTACDDYNFNYLPPVNHEQNVHTPPSWLHNTFPSNSLQQRRDSIPAAMNMTDPTMVVAAGSNSTTQSTSSSIRSTMISPQGSNNNINRMDPSSVDLSESLQFESKYSSGCRF